MERLICLVKLALIVCPLVLLVGCSQNGKNHLQKMPEISTDLMNELHEVCAINNSKQERIWRCTHINKYLYDMMNFKEQYDLHRATCSGGKLMVLMNI